MAQETVVLDHIVEMPTTPEVVYEAFLNPETHGAMTGAEAEGGQEVGDEFSAWDGYIFGKYLELIPNKKIVAEWSTTAWPDDYPPSILELTFEPSEDGTKIHMVHKDVPKEQAEDYDTGWRDYYWKPMALYFIDSQLED